MNKFILSQIFALFSLIATVLCVWQKKRNGILKFLTLDSIFLTISYFLLNAYSGATTNIICAFRNVFFYLKEKNKKFDKLYILIVFIIFHLAVGIKFYSGINSTLPIIGAIVFCITAWQKNPRIVRTGTAIMVLMWLLYDISIKSYVSIITESISFVSAVIAIIKIDILYNEKNFYKRIKKLIIFKKEKSYLLK